MERPLYLVSVFLFALVFVFPLPLLDRSSALAGLAYPAALDTYGAAGPSAFFAATVTAGFQKSGSAWIQLGGG